MRTKLERRRNSITMKKTTYFLWTSFTDCPLAQKWMTVIPPWYTLIPTPPSTISKTRNEHQPNGSDALLLGVKAGIAHSICGCTCGGRLLTCAITEHFSDDIKHYTNVLFTLRTRNYSTILFLEIHLEQFCKRRPVKQKQSREGTKVIS